MEMILSILSSIVGVGIIPMALVAMAVIAFFLRTVVPTNMVHIIQSRKKTVSYGTGMQGGNVYYRWPSWVPILGISRIALQVSNFELSLKGYLAYDKDRVPFELDVTAFFRINDTNMAAQRVASFEELSRQLHFIVQGAVRKILASNDIHQIMIDRATFGQQFTEEVKTELKSWGVEPVKNMELMDIRDAEGSQVIANIMAKRSSFIAMESRMEVARNNQSAETAEIEAKQAVQIREREAEQAVGERTAQKEKAVGVARQKAEQDVKAEEAVTKAKEMEVQRVADVQRAEINRQAAVVTAEQDKQTNILTAEGELEAKKREAEGVKAFGLAEAAASEAKLLAPVKAQTELAREIGGNPGYQTYLVSLEAIKAHVQVGVEQAQALKQADVKIIANTGSPVEGASDVMGLLTSKGGTNLAAAVEAFAQTPMGAQILKNLGVGGDSTVESPKGGRGGNSAHLPEPMTPQ